MDKVLTIPIHLSIDEVKNKLRSTDWEQVRTLIEVAHSFIFAQAAYEVSYINKIIEDVVIIDGVCFRSQVLGRNLHQVGRVFPYVVTIGAGLEEKAKEGSDLLEQYYLDHIGNIALIKARKYLEDHLSTTFALVGLSYMSPGALQDWPLEEQKPLFSLLKGVEKSIGVRLTETLLMIPKKSVSGIFFPTEVTFSSCQLCRRELCDWRKTPFSEDLSEEFKPRR